LAEFDLQAKLQKKFSIQIFMTQEATNFEQRILN